MPLVTLEGIHFELGWEIPPETGATQKNTRHTDSNFNLTIPEANQNSVHVNSGPVVRRPGEADRHTPGAGALVLRRAGHGDALRHAVAAHPRLARRGARRSPHRAPLRLSPGQCLPSFLHSAQPFGQEEVLKGRPSKGQKSLPLMDHSVCAAPGWATFDPTEVKLSDWYPNCWLTASQWHGRERHTTQKIHWTPSKY